MKILVVDDEQVNIIILKKLLEHESHEVLVASNGKEAVQLYDEQQPSLILMDVMMPVMDGYEATKIIKSRDPKKFIPIIFLTAIGGSEALVNCLEKGGDDYINKPFDKKVLHAKISAMERIFNLQNTVTRQNNELIRMHDLISEEHILAEQVYDDVVGSRMIESDLVNMYHKPADQFNGDIILSVRSPRGGINFLVGDFTGHGLAAAICALPVVDIFQRMSSIGADIKDIVLRVNEKIRKFLPKGKFFAACFIYVDAKHQVMNVWNGGMPDVLLVDPKKGIRRKIESNNLPLGILPNDQISLETEQYNLVNREKLIIYSDGIIEAENQAHELFGQEKLDKLINQHAKEKNIKEKIVSALNEFTEGTAQSDDITLLEVLCDFDGLLKVKNQVSEPNITGNWEFTLKFDAKTLKSIDAIPVMLAMLTDIQDFSACSEKLFIVVSEMYSNALEHGLLKMGTHSRNSVSGFESYYVDRKKRLDALVDGEITFTCYHKVIEGQSCLTLVVEDSGEGFNVDRVWRNIQETKHGKHKGLMLLRSLCRKVSHNKIGNQIIVEFDGFNN